ncbi:hypothetical protein ACFVFN_17285, partial [Streptomyces pharetrae]
MSTDARHAPVPPRPTAPPAPGTPEPSADRRTTGPARADEPGTAPAPRRPDQAPLTLPPPPASARFPDLPPPTPQGTVADGFLETPTGKG